MAAEAFVLTQARTPKGRSKKNTFVAIIPDATFLGVTVQKIAATEIQKEITKGNPPQNIIVDNRDGKRFSDAKFRITTLFSDPKLIAMAAVETVKQLQNLTRKLTGNARSKFEVWTVEGKKDPGKRVYANAGGVSLGTFEKLASTLPLTGRIVIAGPMVDYGRKLYWNPMGRTETYKYKGRAQYSAGYEETTGRLSRVWTGTRNTNMKELLLGRIRRRFPGTLIIGRWVEDKTVNGDNRWPGIGIGLKAKGKL